jgi:hypothetical protein
MSNARGCRCRIRRSILPISILPISILPISILPISILPISILPMLLISVLLLVTVIHSTAPLAASAFSDQPRRWLRARSLQQDNGMAVSSTDDAVVQRVRIGKFKVILSSTPTPFTAAKLDQIYNEIETAVESYIRDNEPNAAAADARVDYVYMGSMVVDTFADSQTTVSFSSGGVAAFIGTAPTEEQMDGWVEQAIDTRLVPVLAATADFPTIQTAQYISDQQSNATVVGREPLASNSDNSDLPLVLILGAGGCGLLVTALLLGLVGHRRRRRHSRPAMHHLQSGVEITSENLSKSIANSGPTSPGLTEESWGELDSEAARRQPRAIFPRSEEAKSIADSESSFTVNSEAGDSVGLQSLHPHFSTPASLSTESFERERRVSIRKDMLTSPWAGQAASGRPVQTESVLAPSHFTASQERRHVVKRSADEGGAVDAWANGEDVGEMGGISGASLRFESAEAAGDDAFLKPPSKLGKSSGRKSEIV